MKHLPIDSNNWEFVTREKDPAGKTVIFRCGRNFLYYALHYYHPQIFNLALGGPQALEATIGKRTVPTWLLFSALHLRQLPAILLQHNLLLHIDTQPVRT